LIKITGTFIRSAAITAGLSLSCALAQGPPDPGEMVQMRVDRMSDVLKLNKDQQKQISAIYTDAVTANQQLMVKMRDANQSLAQAIKSNDSNGIIQAANTIGTLTAQMTVNNAKAEAAVYALLSPDQQAKYQPGRGMGRGMGMGMGGPAGRGRRGPPEQ